MASFVAPNTGIVTADDRVHKYLWVSIDDADMAAKLKTWQSWIVTPNAINGITVWSYADLLALAVEILLPGPGIADDLILTAPPGPSAIMRGLAAALGGDRPPPQSRAQGAKLLAHKARSFSPADITAVTLVPADLVQRQGTYIPVWQRITYHEAEHMGGGLTLAWLHYYDPSAVRSGLTASTALDSIRARAVAARILRPNLAAPRQPPPGPNDPQNQGQVDAAAGALAVHNLTPQPDSIPADEVKFAVLNLLGGNQYQANRQLRTDHPEGAARRAAMTEEIDSFPIGIDGLSPGYRNRLRVAIGAAGQAGDPNHLNDFLGDERQSAAGLLASMKDMAQSLLPPEMQKDALLYTTQGIRALNIALVTHAAYFEHHRAAAASAGAAAPTVEARLEQLAVRVGEIDATGGAITAAFGGGQVSSANQSGAGRTACRASWTAAAARPENARVLLWLSDMLEDESTTSVEIHRALFVSANAAHPDWRSTGFLHALGWGHINAALLDHKYALIYDYATDYYSGLYLADALVSAAVRSRLVTAAQQVWLSGLSLTALAKSLRAENWAGVDIVNDVDNAIQSELATISYRAAPPKTPLAVTFCDTVTVTRAVIFLKALMEALGLQRDGDGSVAELMTDGNAAIISNTTFSVAAMCRIVEAYQAIYKAAITATGRAYTWTHSDVNVRADLPTRNYPPTAIEGLLRNLKMLHDRLAAAEDAAATQRLLKSMGDSAPPPAAGQSNVSAAAILLTSGCFDALAKVSEAFVFIYLGMALLAFPIFSHHTLWLLTIVALVACLLGRLHVFPLLWLAARLQAQRCGGAEARRPASAQAPLGLRPKHAVCIWFSGLRGGVAFALAAASYEARDFPARCGGRPALAAAAADDAADDARGEGWLFSHCPRELNDSLAIVQATLLLAVFTIFVYGAAARDVALLCGALPQPGAGRDEGSGVDSGRVDECAELTLDEPTGEASDAELEARRNAATSRLPASSRWNALNARLVLLLTRQRAPLHARAPRPLKTMDSDADL